MAPKTKIKRLKFSQSDFFDKRINARYDAAQTTKENIGLWSNVDALSAAAANSPAVRRVIRNRARYETANNSYAGGIVKTLANDVIGPRIQLQLGDSDLHQKTEIDFLKWAQEIRLFSKLRTARRARCIDGEAFALLVTNPRLKNNVKLDVRLIECDMIEGFFTSKEDEVDGIKFDKYGNVIAYRLLDQHPGDHRFISNKSKGGGKWIDAKYVLHYFACDRPGQKRGISELVSSMSLFGQLRAYTASVVESARRAAEISGIIETNLLPEGMGAAEFDSPSISMDIERNMLISLPEGWNLKQFKAEQPTNTYPEFKSELIGEAGRGFNMPRNVATGNSAKYNYASGRLDFQTYDRSIEIEHVDLEDQILNRTYFEWLDDYANKESLSYTEIMDLSSPTWFYASRGHVDPAKEANADNIRLRNGTLTKSAYYAKQGKDGKQEAEKRINELIAEEKVWNDARKKAGLEPAVYPSGIYQEQIRVTKETEKEDDDE